MCHMKKPIKGTNSGNKPRGPPPLKLKKIIISEKQANDSNGGVCCKGYGDEDGNDEVSLLLLDGLVDRLLAGALSLETPICSWLSMRIGLHTLSLGVARHSTRRGCLAMPPHAT